MFTGSELNPTEQIGRLVMRRPVSVPPDAPLLAVAEVMADESIGAVLVSGPRGPLGIVSERDLALALAENGDAAGLEARDFMTPDLATVDGRVSILEAARMMVAYEIRHLIVESHGTAIGVVSMRDLLPIFTESNVAAV
jgi:signal-transduction protein with cAMP-binding, CBS, and nucleotidyltransferase domain